MNAITTLQPAPPKALTDFIQTHINPIAPVIMRVEFYTDIMGMTETRILDFDLTDFQSNAEMHRLARAACHLIGADDFECIELVNVPDALYVFGVTSKLPIFKCGFEKHIKAIRNAHEHNAAEIICAAAELGIEPGDAIKQRLHFDSAREAAMELAKQDGVMPESCAFNSIDWDRAVGCYGIAAADGFVFLRGEK